MKLKKSKVLLLLGILIVFVLAGCSNGEPVTYELDTAVEGKGYVEPSGGTYDRHERFQLTAVSEDGWIFAEWQGGIKSFENPYDVVMTGDLSVVALFVEANNSFTIDITGEGNVKEELVDYTDADIYAIQLTAEAAPGWKFAEWKVDGEFYSESLIEFFEINEDKSIEAVFEEHEDFLQGKFKLINSWGEAIPEYYITYEAAIENHFFAYSFEPGVGYEPEVIAVFEIEGKNRGAWDIILKTKTGEKKGLGIYYPEHYGSGIYGGDHPFPDNALVLDITELMPFEDIDIIVSNDSSYPGKLKSFAVEIHEDGYSIDNSNAKIYTADIDSAVDIGAGETETVTISNIDTQGAQFLQMKNGFNLRSLSRELTDKDIDSLVSDNDRSNRANTKSRSINKRATGLEPLTREELERARIEDTIRVIDTEAVLNRLGFEVKCLDLDYSTSRYFPPIGDQGKKGSCAAWTMAYYIQGFYQAREKGWDFKGASIKTADQSQLMSPQFAYHLVNRGKDEGATLMEVVQVLSKIGVSSLEEMPYDENESESWPDEDAWREAPKYRSKNSKTLYLVEVNDYAGVKTIQALLEEGYLFGVAVDAEQYDKKGHEILWTVDNYNAGAENINHGNTIVGFVE